MIFSLFKKLHLNSPSIRLGAIMLLVVLLHLPFMDEPPRSIHVWRQCNTLSMSRNLYEEGMNILKPKVDRRYDTNGITGSQFLSYEWILAALFKLFGFHENYSRWLSLIFLLLSIVGFWKLLQEITSNSFAIFGGTLAFSFSPELFYQGINALPDILALCVAIWGMALFFKWNKHPQRLDQAIVWILCIVLAGLTKLQYLACGIPLFILFIQGIRQKAYSRRIIIGVVVSGVIGLMICLSWYAYARYLIEISGLRDIGIVFNPMTDIKKGLDIIAQNLVSDLPELLTGYAGFVLFILGIVVFVKDKLRHHPLMQPFLVWFIFLMLYHLIELGQMGVHQYYMLPYYPLLFIIVALGSKFLAARQPKIFYFLVLLIPIVSCLRIIPARWLPGKEGIPMSFYNKSTRDTLERLTPNSDRILTGPDASGCINFYFLHKKGFSFEKNGQAFDSTWDKKIFLDDAIARGAKYAYLYDQTEMNDTRWLPYLKHKLYQNNEFLVIELQPKIDSTVVLLK